jgi:hypothetical protein
MPRQDARGSPYEPTQAVPRAGDDLQREQDQRGPAEVAPAQDGVGGFGNSGAGSVVKWNVPAAKVYFNDLIAGASVAGDA